jgi:archaeal flagellin N-terminal-like domain
MLEKQHKSGVSPVIGIILMVAVTVGLVALASTIVFDLGSNVNEPADVSANIEYDNESEEVIAEVVRNENAQSIETKFSTGSSKGGEFVTSAGKTGTQVVDVSGIKAGTAELVATVGETGNEQIISTVEYPKGSGA